MEGLRESADAERQPGDGIAEQIKSTLNRANDLYREIFLDLKDGQLAGDEKRARLKQLAAAANEALTLIAAEIEVTQRSDPAWLGLADKQRLAKELSTYAVRA